MIFTIQVYKEHKPDNKVSGFEKTRSNARRAMDPKTVLTKDIAEVFKLLIQDDS